MNRILPALVCGFAAAVLSAVPIIKSFSCCLIVPVAAFLSLYLYQKANNDFGRIVPAKALFYGMMTGVFAALFTTLFESIFLYISRSAELSLAISDVQNLFSEFKDNPAYDEMMDSLYKIVDEIKENGFSATYTFSMLFVTLIAHVIFGIIGALFGMQFLNRKNSEQGNF